MKRLGGSKDRRVRQTSPNGSNASKRVSAAKVKEPTVRGLSVAFLPCLCCRDTPVPVGYPARWPLLSRHRLVMNDGNSCLRFTRIISQCRLGNAKTVWLATSVCQLDRAMQRGGLEDVMDRQIACIARVSFHRHGFVTC